jgi:predicted MPP superfamily phosphohydrolase
MKRSPQPQAHGSLFRIAVAHSPDQYPWAQNYDFDLMLAGHTHGGQIRFPVIGPVLSPSRFGVKYAAGTFYEAPTLMHVSRGIAGTRPLRFNCPPELSKLVLRREAVD